MTKPQATYIKQWQCYEDNKILITRITKCLLPGEKKGEILKSSLYSLISSTVVHEAHSSAFLARKSFAAPTIYTHVSTIIPGSLWVSRQDNSSIADDSNGTIRIPETYSPHRIRLDAASSATQTRVAVSPARTAKFCGRSVSASWLMRFLASFL